MKKLFLSFVVLCVGVFAMAQTSFYVYKTDRSMVEHTMTDVDSISFVKPATGTASGYENGYGYVDLGLPSGLKWATCNVGATSQEEYGNYYAWGETLEPLHYDWDYYKYHDDNSVTKYNSTDNLTTLEAADDVATTKWGGKWRMPTWGEWKELFANCTCTWTTLNGVNGYEVKGSNGLTIFLPAAGYRYSNYGYYSGYSDYLKGAGDVGYYWSSSHHIYHNTAWYEYFSSGSVSMDYEYRYYGLSVRPVCK